MKRWTVQLIALGSLALLVPGCSRESSEPASQPMATPAATTAEPPPPPTPPEPPRELPPVATKAKPRGTRSSQEPSRSPVGAGAAVARRRAAGASAKLSDAVALPSAVRVGDTIVSPGSYQVRLDPADGGMAIALLQNNLVVASELAVQPVRQPSRDATGAWLWHDTRQESTYRVYYQAGRSLWFATFPIAP